MPQIYMIIFWAIIIVGTVILELATADLVSVWFTVGAFCALFANLFGASETVQFGVFIIGSAIFIVLTRPLAKKLSGRSVVRTNADRFIDMTGEVTREVPNDGGRGEVKVNGTLWGAFTTQKENIPVGSKVIVQDIVGNKLLVAPVSEKEI